VDLGLEGATVVISGGSKGMGRAAAERFAAEGARVAVLARGQAAIDDCTARLSELGAQEAVGLSIDLTDRATVDTAFAQLGDRWGALNVLVNAAGPVEVGIGTFESIDDGEWAATFDIGTISAARCVRAAPKDYMRALPVERSADPDDLVDAMRIIREDFGHPAHLGRAGDPAEIGAVIAFVGSRANSYMTGADINVDGGSDF